MCLVSRLTIRKFYYYSLCSLICDIKYIYIKMNMIVQGNSRRNSDIVYDIEDSPEKSRDIEASLKEYDSNGSCSRGSLNSNAADEGIIYFLP